MFKSKNILWKKVYDTNGKKIGMVKDIFIDIHKGNIEGIDISNFYSFRKKNNVSSKNILSIEEAITIKKESMQCSGMRFSKIKDMEVRDLNGGIKGNVEDLLIDEVDFSIKGLIVSPGILEKLIHGKEIILLNKARIKQDYILYTEDSNVVLKNIRHEENKNDFNKEK